MVRDNIGRTVEQSQKQSCVAETQIQSQPSEEVAEPQKALGSPEKQEEHQLDFLHWRKLNFEEEPETWQQVSMLRVLREVHFKQLQINQLGIQIPGLYS